MFVQNFFIEETFPFQLPITNWNDVEKGKVKVNA